MAYKHGPRLAQIPTWKKDRIVELYFQKKMMKTVIVERLNVPWSTVLRVIRKYEECQQ